MFWSLMVLRSTGSSEDLRPAHDYLDDMEAIFWIFCFLVFAPTASGKHVPKTKMKTEKNKKAKTTANTELHDLLVRWRSTNPSSALEAKSSFLLSAMALKELKGLLHSSWPEVCAELLLELKNYMGELANRKKLLLYETQEPLADGTIPNRFATILKDVNTHYAHILRLFDNTLEALGQSLEAKTSALPLSPPLAGRVLHPTPLTRDSKRRGDADSAEAEESSSRPKQVRFIYGPSEIEQPSTTFEEE